MPTALSALALALLQAGDPSAQWVWFDSRESGRGPELALVASDGSETVLPAAEDDLLISYLADGCYGAHPQLSVDRGDRNRVLVRFDLPSSAAFERALLRLELHQSNLPTTEPFELGLHAVRGGWSEASTTWSDQPDFAREPVHTVYVGPAEGPVEIDVTGIARTWTSGARSNHGLLLRAAAPLAPSAGPGRSADEVRRAAAVEAELASLFRWSVSFDAALGEARRTGRRVLVVISAAFRPEELTEHERLLLATCLSHPDVRAAVERDFVPVRVRVSPNHVAMAWELEPARRPRFPLEGVGLDHVGARPPALAIVSPEGEAPRVAANIGVFDHEEVLRLLGAQAPARPADLSRALALVRAGDLEAAIEALAAVEGAEARYWRAASLQALGERGAAAGLLTELAGDEDAPLWGLKARARLAFPELAGGYEALRAPSRGSNPPQIAAGAVRHLLESQLPDGSFPMGHPTFEEHREGITALCALALLERGEEEAAGRATSWLKATAGARDPELLNSFTATYWLELELARHARGLATDAGVEAAIARLAGGQMESGAWSYSKRWGEGWTGGFGPWPATERGRAHGMNTAIAMEVLTRARELGFAVPEAVLEAGRDALLGMRAGPATFTYTWPEPRNFETPDASIGRAPAAETALWRLGATPREDLSTAVRTFVDGRATLHPPAKLSDSWLPPHGLSGYFHSFAYFHGAHAVLALDGEARKADLAKIGADVLFRVEADGTWMDTIGLGKPYATAMALLILGLAGDQPKK
jgi:hypothetical protein